MSEAYIGEIRIFAGNFAPQSWAFCDGRSLSISENDALFALIGTTYGGDGVNTFNLPDLRGRLPVHMGTDSNGNTYVEGQSTGVENVTLTTSQIPSHNHILQASKGGTTTSSPASAMLRDSGVDMYANSLTAPVAMNNAAIANAGGNQPHSNLQPYLCLSFIIALFGIFPSRN